ncbi:MAG: MAPEG family protein, partial [Pseudomonadota bacterium]|nr:MAPEG family protein [Pseudomonadota bacterium]
PFAVVLLIIAEITGMPLPAVHAAGIVLVASRLIHAWGLSHSPGRTFGRFYGTAGTWLVITALSLWILFATTAVFRFPGSG